MRDIHINKTLGITIVILIAALVAFGTWAMKTNFVEELRTSRSGQVSTDNGGANSDEKDTDRVQTSESENITVYEPDPQEEVGLPLIVTGEARVFENTVNIRLLDSDGSTLVEVFTTADSPDVGEFGEFEAELNYPEPTGETGTVEVFSISARDGSEINKVQIPINFKDDVASTTVRVYFTTTTTGVGNTCEATDFVERRIPETQAVAEAAISELLKGPTINEQEDNFRTGINAGTELQSIRIENGVAYADFNPMLDMNIGGSCLVSAIYSQIENTLEQFSTVDDVVISIDGETETVLQP